MKFKIQKEKYRLKYKRYLLDNEIEPVDWGNGYQTKYCAYFSHWYKKVKTDITWLNQNQGTIYTTRKESIYEFAKQIGEDNFIKYILIGEYREE